MQSSRDNNFFQKISFHGSVCLAIFGLFYFLQYFLPVSYVHLIAEDSWGEQATFASFFISFVLLGWVIFADRKLLISGYSLIAAGLLFIALEEISYGQRLFGIETPYFITKVNYQSELNLHNIIDGIKPLVLLFGAGVLVWIFVLPFLVKQFRVFEKLVSVLGVPLVPTYLWPYFIGGCFLTFFPVIVENDEIGELILGIAFVAFTSDIWWKRIGISIRTMSQRLFLSCLLGVLFVITALLTLSLTSDMFRWSLLNTAGEYSKSGLNTQTEKLYLYILKNKQYKNEETLYQYGTFLKKINSDKADAVLEESLAEQYLRIQASPDKPALNRIVARILRMLNREEDAQSEFQKALEKDRVRLAKAEEDWAKLTVLTSLGETSFEIGEYDAALKYFQSASALATQRFDKGNLKNWIKKTSGKTGAGKSG